MFVPVAGHLQRMSRIFADRFALGGSTISGLDAHGVVQFLVSAGAGVLCLCDTIWRILKYIWFRDLALGFCSNKDVSKNTMIDRDDVLN